MNKLINLTPHAVVLVLPDGGTRAVEPSGSVARCAMETVQFGEAFGVPLRRASYGEVSGLPAPEEGVVYIVSALVRAAVPARGDVASPSDFVRNEAGQVVGCKALDFN